MSALFWALAAGALQAPAEKAGPEFTRFELSRERVRHRVVAEGTLANLLAVDLTEVRVTIAFYDGDREVRRSPTAHLGTIAAGRSAALNLETEQVEKFDRFEVLVESADRRFLYRGRDPSRPPELLRAPPPRVEVSSVRDIRPERFPGTVRVTAAVRNAGVVPAREPDLALEFSNPPGRAVRTVRVRLGAAIEPSSEETFEVTVPDCPEYASLRASAACALGDVPIPPDPFQRLPELEIGQCRLVRMTDGSVRVTGMVRNGLSRAVRKVVVTFRLGGTQERFAVDATLGPGEVRAFEGWVARAGAVDGYTYEASFEEAEAGAEPAPPARPGVRSLGARRVESPAASGPRATVALRGIAWIRPASARGSRPKADVAFLKLAVRGPEGRSLHPAGTLSFAAQVGGAGLLKGVREIREEAWGRDADELQGPATSAESVAYDPLTGELYVGLIPVEPPGAPVRFDVRLKLDGLGEWEWKGLQTPFQSEARGPDREK
jgi:hypothetical protein